MSAPLSYQSIPPASEGPDTGYLRALAICHYVWGGLCMAISCVFIIHIVMGILMLSDPAFFNNGNVAAPSPPPPPFIGWMMIGMGSCFILLGWTIGILTICSGRCIHKRRKRIFSMVIAGINCLSVPFGTTLGVFTIIVLLRPTVQAMYDARAGQQGS